VVVDCVATVVAANVSIIGVVGAAGVVDVDFCGLVFPLLMWLIFGVLLLLLLFDVVVDGVGDSDTVGAVVVSIGVIGVAVYDVVAVVGSCVSIVGIVDTQHK